MIDKREELTQSSKDLINLAFGAFLPIIGMLGKFWFEAAQEPIHPKGDDGPKTFEQKDELKAGE